MGGILHHLVSSGVGGWELISSDSGSGANPAVTFTDAQEGDLVVVCWASDTQNPPSELLAKDDEGSITADGWYMFSSNTTSANEAHGYKVMGATPDTGISYTQPGALCCYVWRGVDTATPLNADNTSSSSSGMPDPPSITTTNNKCLIIAFGSLDDDEVSATAPSGYSGILTPNTTATAMMAYKIQDTAGTENPAAFGGIGADGWVATTAAFNLK